MTLRTRLDDRRNRHAPIVLPQPATAPTTRRGPEWLQLVDLYRNLGNADPILIASALEAKEAAAASLFTVDWCVVTDDAAVVAKARQFDVATLGYDEFLPLLSPGADELG